MSWITEVQADNYLSPNPKWDEFTNKEELLKLATNRLEQLTFKDEPINRVGARYLDGKSLAKEEGVDTFIIDAQNGNWDYHEALGWERNITGTLGFDLIVSESQVAFWMRVIAAGQVGWAKKALTFKDIQTLHTFGGDIGGFISLEAFNGSKGCYSSIETQQANAIIDSDGEQVFSTDPNRRIGITFKHNEVNLFIDEYEGMPEILLDGVTQVTVINEQGIEETNIVPAIVPLEYFTYRTRVKEGLDKILYLYINDVLVANPGFNKNTDASSLDGNRVIYSSGLPGLNISQSRKITYVRSFGATINTENPITIPIRLVSACALLAFEYGKFPPNVVGDKEYQRNKNNYNIMQDLPINVQAAVEPFLANYESLIDENGIATITERNTLPVQIFKPKMTSLEYT